jgi:uncharacterized protein YndB with AHSA1/START domain
VRTLSASQVIDRPRAEVFRWFAEDHVANHPRWDPDIRLEADEPVALGTVIRRTNARYGDPVHGTMEVVTFEPPSRFAVVIREGGTEMPGSAEFEEVTPARTRLTIRTAVPASLPAESISQGMQRSVDTIKRLIEQD